MKLIVSGARDGMTTGELEATLDLYLPGQRLHHPGSDRLILIEGCAPGVDTQVEAWARSHRFNEIFGRHWDWHIREPRGNVLVHYPAQWGLHRDCRCGQGRKTCNYAGHRRNLEMIDQLPDEVLTAHPFIANSKGTKHMATTAKARKVKLTQIGSTL